MKLLNNSGGLKLATFPWVCSCPAQLWPASFRLSEPLRGRVRWLVMSTTSEIGLISQNTNKYGWTRCEYQLLLETGRIGWLVRWSKDLHQLKLPHSFPYYFEVKNFKVSPPSLEFDSWVFSSHGNSQGNSIKYFDINQWIIPCTSCIFLEAEELFCACQNYWNYNGNAENSQLGMWTIIFNS